MAFTEQKKCPGQCKRAPAVVSYIYRMGRTPEENRRTDMDTVTATREEIAAISNAAWAAYEAHQAALPGEVKAALKDLVMNGYDVEADTSSSVATLKAYYFGRGLPLKIRRGQDVMKLGLRNASLMCACFDVLDFLHFDLADVIEETGLECVYEDELAAGVLAA